MLRRLPIFVALLWAGSVFAQPTPTPVADTKPAVAVPVAAPAETPVVAPAPIPEPPPVIKVTGDKVSINDVITDAKDVADAVKAFKDAKTAGDKLATRLGLMVLLAACFKVLLSLLKFTSEWWKGDKAKLVLRISTLGLGIVVALLSHFAAGEGWMSAIMLGISGPLAISFHELFDVIVGLVQKKKPA